MPATEVSEDQGRPTQGVASLVRRGNYVRAAIRRARKRGLEAGRQELLPLARQLGRLLFPEVEAADRRDQLEAHLPLLLRSDILGRWSQRTRLLFDLQAVVFDADRGDPIDYVEWFRTVGARPARRPLTELTRLTRLRRIGRVIQRLELRRLGKDAEALGATLRAWHRVELPRFRDEVRPRLVAALERAGLATDNAADAAAVYAVADQLLTRALSRGGTDFGDIRDAIAANPAKLRDVASAGDWWAGDALLKADQEVAVVLDGIHHRGEFYLRWLQSFQALGFGTAIGRVVSMYLVFPFVGAYVLLFFGEYVSHYFGAHPHLTELWEVIPVGLLFVLLLNVPLARQIVAAPFALLREAVSRAFARQKRAPAKERTGLLHDAGRWLAARWRGLFETIDASVYVIDEWLRYRGGDRRGARQLEATLALLWFVIGYGLRFAFRLVIEPTVNPLKHFPTVTVAGKISFATVYPVLAYYAAQVMPRWLAVGLVAPLVAVYIIPGFFGFLVWELRANWRLFAANRPDRFRPAVVGRHGESMLRLLRPGVYSGTIPRTLRRIEDARALGDTLAELRQLHHLHEVEEGIRAFLGRQLVAVVESSTTFADARVTIEGVEVEPYEVRARLRVGEVAVALGFHYRQRELRGSAHFDGALTARQRTVLEVALAGLFAFALVDDLDLDGTSPVPLGITQSGWLEFWELEAAGDVRPKDAVRLITDGRLPTPASAA